MNGCLAGSIGAQQAQARGACVAQTERNFEKSPQGGARIISKHLRQLAKRRCLGLQVGARAGRRDNAFGREEIGRSNSGICSSCGVHGLCSPALRLDWRDYVLPVWPLHRRNLPAVCAHALQSVRTDFPMAVRHRTQTLLDYFSAANEKRRSVPAKSSNALIPLASARTHQLPNILEHIVPAWVDGFPELPQLLLAIVNRLERRIGVEEFPQSALSDRIQQHRTRYKELAEMREPLAFVTLCEVRVRGRARPPASHRP